MLTNEQKSLLKRAQRQAEISDLEYREALQLIAGVQSSTDPAIGDRHLDKLMGYFEAIYWRKVDCMQVDDPDYLAKHGMKRQWLPFLARDYWKNKNTAKETSRDRYVTGNLAADIATLETGLAVLGFGAAYCTQIRLRVTGGHGTAKDLLNYKSALARTLESKQKQKVEQPF